MSTNDLKQALYQSVAKMAQALANGNRLQLLEFMAQGERSVDELAAMTGLAVANTSQHLQALRQAGLVVARKEGQRVYYALAGDDVALLHQVLRRVAELRMAEVDRLVRDFIGHRDALEPSYSHSRLPDGKSRLIFHKKLAVPLSSEANAGGSDEP